MVHGQQEQAPAPWQAGSLLLSSCLDEAWYMNCCFYSSIVGYGTRRTTRYRRMLLLFLLFHRGRIDREQVGNLRALGFRRQRTPHRVKDARDLRRRRRLLRPIRPRPHATHALIPPPEPLHIVIPQCDSACIGMYVFRTRSARSERIVEGLVRSGLVAVRQRFKRLCVGHAGVQRPAATLELSENAAERATVLSRQALVETFRGKPKSIQRVQISKGLLSRIHTAAAAAAAAAAALGAALACDAARRDTITTASGCSHSERQQSSVVAQGGLPLLHRGAERGSPELDGVQKGAFVSPKRQQVRSQRREVVGRVVERPRCSRRLTPRPRTRRARACATPPFLLRSFAS